MSNQPRPWDLTRNVPDLGALYDNANAQRPPNPNAKSKKLMKPLEHPTVTFWGAFFESVFKSVSDPLTGQPIAFRIFSEIPPGRVKEAELGRVDRAVIAYEFTSGEPFMLLPLEAKGAEATNADIGTVEAQALDVASEQHRQDPLARPVWAATLWGTKVRFWIYRGMAKGGWQAQDLVPNKQYIDVKDPESWTIMQNIEELLRTARRMKPHTFLQATFPSSGTLKASVVKWQQLQVEQHRSMLQPPSSLRQQQPGASAPMPQTPQQAPQQALSPEEVQKARTLAGQHSAIWNFALESVQAQGYTGATALRRTVVHTERQVAKVARVEALKRRAPDMYAELLRRAQNEGHQGDFAEQRVVQLLDEQVNKQRAD